MKSIISSTVKLGIVAVCIFLHTSAYSKPRPPQPPWPEAALRIYGFDSVYQRGPWKDIAINEESSVADSWSGHSLVRAGFSSLLPVVIPVDVESKRPNYKLDSGAIRFWYAPNWSSAESKQGGRGPGHLASLIELVSLDEKKPTVKWSLCVNDTGDTIYLAGEGKAGTTIYLKAPIQFEAGDWRMITLGYSGTNTALWMDGELVAKGEGLPAGDWWETKNLGLVVGSDIYASASSIAEGQFEELTTLPHWPSKTKWQDMHFTAIKRRTLVGTMGTREEEQAKVAALKSVGLLPEDYGSMAKSSGEGDGPMAYSYAAGTLWLEIAGVSNNLAHLIIHGTTPDVAYEILSKESLTNAEWAGELPIVIGATGQDWTPTTVTVGTRTNNLFLWARTLADADGDGLPDWWELAHNLDPNNPDTGNTGVSDGYKDSDNDGWTNLQEYQNGTSPSQYNTPGTLGGFAVSTDASGTHAKLSWLPASGPVTGYTIERGSDNSLISVGSASRSHVDSQTTLPTGLYEYWLIPTYRVRAEYSGSSSDWSEWQNVADLNAPVSQIIRGQGSNASVFIFSIPSFASAVRVGVPAYNSGIGGYVSLAHVDLFPNQFTNGVATLPASIVQLSATNYWSPYVQFIQTNSAVSAYIQSFETLKPFWDGRAQLKDNLRFQLRIPTMYEGFDYVLRTPHPSGGWWYSTISQQATYAYSGFRKIYDYWDFDWNFVYRRFVQQYRRETLPFEDNYEFKHFVCNTTNLTTSGRPKTGVVFDSGGMVLFLTNEFNFVPPVSGNTLPSFLNTNAARWMFYENVFGSGQPTAYGWMIANPGNDLEVTANSSSPGWLLSMSGNAKNWFGLPYTSYLLAWSNNPSGMAVLTPSSPVQHPGFGYFYPEAAQPAFQLVDYYFTHIVNEVTPTIPPMPGYTDFETTNTTPSLFITSVGDPSFTLSGHAKLAVTNGYSGVYGYLGQYFDRAYTTTNGVATTNQTGILSPYGEFFPTEPGRTALVTMPDIDTGQRGTATVYAVSMNLDANHDGVMDRTFYGPDQTSAAKPFRFWINNDNDSYKGSDFDASWRRDCDDNIIGYQRDLEDFARLWISGLPSLPATNDYTVTLSWRNYTGNPTIKLYPAYEADGGNLYLQDTNTAFYQIQYTNAYGVLSGPGACLVTSNPNAAVTFPADYFRNFGRKHFLFEAAEIGAGELVLTVSQGTNTLAETSVFMDLKNAKDMYEQAHIENVTDAVPNPLVSIFKEDNNISAYAGESKQVIVFVHGWRMPQFEYYSFSESMFKRLYWQGYQGRFASLRWPTDSSDNAPATQFFTYNKSEFKAFQSGRAASAYFTKLRQRFPSYSIGVCAHSMGNIVMAQALKQQITDGHQDVDNYVLMQAASPVHCYDTNFSNYLPFLIAQTNSPTPDTYRGYPGAINSAVRNRILNFFNTNDFALATGTLPVIGAVHWEANQKDYKPDSGFGYGFDGVNAFKSAAVPGSPRILTDPREIMAFVARPRSKAVGAQPGVGGVIATAEQVDLKSSYGFDIDRSEHSAQFNWNIQKLNGFYAKLLASLFPSP